MKEVWVGTTALRALHQEGILMGAFVAPHTREMIVCDLAGEERQEEMVTAHLSSVWDVCPSR